MDNRMAKEERMTQNLKQKGTDECPRGARDTRHKGYEGSLTTDGYKIVAMTKLSASRNVT